MPRWVAVADLTVVSIPVYFGTMGAEYLALKRSAADRDPVAGDYERNDTLTSLAMGVGSLVAPLVVPRLTRHITPGKGRFAKALIGSALGAAAVTTVADRIAARSLDRRRRRAADRVRRVTGPVALGAGTLAVATFAADRTNPVAQWRVGRRRDRGTGPLALGAAILGWDAIYYWNHRLQHEVRGLWAIHVVHHSSEHYNLSTALRQPVADAAGVFVPYGLLARAGIRPALIEQARGLNLLYQYWIHTETIRRLGPAEEVLNTPSHHRVHHGSNRRYLDRNHGSILILWDRLFGTFAREEEPVVYGLTKNIESFDPRVVVGHEYRSIVADVAGATNWHDRMSYLLRGPGWRPDAPEVDAAG